MEPKNAPAAVVAGDAAAPPAPNTAAAPEGAAHEGAAAEGTTATEGEASAVVAAPAAEKPPKLVDRLLGGKGELPEWAAELVAEQAETGEYDLPDEVIEQLPIEAKQLIALAIHRGKSAKTELDAQLAAQKKAEAIAADREVNAKKLESDAFKWARDPNLKAFIEAMKPKGDAPDPFSPEGIEHIAQRKAAEMMEKWFGAIQQADASITEAARQAEADRAESVKRDELKSYIQANVEDFRNPEMLKRIKALVSDTGGKISAQRAHKLVLAEMALETADDGAAALAEARKRVQPGGGAGRPIPTLPISIEGDINQVEAWYQKNPAARARDLAEAMRAASIGETMKRRE